MIWKPLDDILWNLNHPGLILPIQGYSNTTLQCFGIMHGFRVLLVNTWGTLPLINVVECDRNAVSKSLYLFITCF